MIYSRTIAILYSFMKTETPILDPKLVAQSLKTDVLTTLASLSDVDCILVQAAIEEGASLSDALEALSVVTATGPFGLPTAQPED